MRQLPPCLPKWGSRAAGPGGGRGGKAPRLAVLCLLAACSADPRDTPLDFFHGLEGGEIAQQRPPPPGVGMPYPHLGTVPAKPVMTDPAYRTSLRTQLAAERDRTELVDADSPIAPLDVPPPPKPAPLPKLPPKPLAATPGAEEAPEPDSGAAATLNTAEAAPPAAVPPAPAKNAPAASADVGGVAGPAPGTPLTIAGAQTDPSGYPVVPDAPPLPASFEGVPAQPAPSRAAVAVRIAAAGTPVFFAPGTAVLEPSQIDTLKNVVKLRRGQTIQIIGQGDAFSDTPEGQAAAIALALHRADAVRAGFEALHVPQSAMRIGADAFGRGAVLRLLP